MNLKRLVSFILISSFILPSLAMASGASLHASDDQENFLSVDDEGNGQVCSAPVPVTVNENCNTSTGGDNDALSALDPVNNALGETPVPTCNDQDLQYGDKPMSKEEVAQTKKDLLKQCNEAYKMHKRKFAKQLFKNGRPFKALGVLLRKRKKLKDIHHKRIARDDIKAEGESLADVEAKIKLEEQKVIDEIKQQYPGGIDESDPYYNDNGKLFKKKYKYGVDGQMSTPSNVYVKDGDRTCKIDVDLPKIEAVDLPPSDMMPPLDITDSFPDDCAFMVSGKHSEKDALNLLGSKNRTDYCSNNQQIDNSDHAKKDKSGKDAFDYIDQLGESFKKAATQGLTPDFTLNVSRNLYADETKPLAQKRGEYIQKYLFQKIQEDTKDSNVELPAWATDYSEFQKVFKIQHPSYEGLSTVGDYGPNPSAKPEEFEKEKQNLKTTLEAQNGKTKDAIANIENASTGSVKRISDELLVMEKRKIELEKSRSKLSSTMEKRTDFTNVNQDIDTLNQQTTELFQLNYDIAKSKRDLEQEKQMLVYYKAKLAKSVPDQQVKLLDEFYNNRPESFDRDYKNKWDDKLFKNFKMVAVEGTFSGEKQDDLEMDDYVTPKIKYMMSNVIKAEAFTCDYSIKDAKSTRIRHNKGNYKWGKAIARTVWNPIWVSVKFTAFGWLVGLLGMAKKIGPATCPSFDQSAFARYMRWGNIKKRQMGKKGNFYKHEKSVGKYDGDYNVWPEAQEAFK